MATRFIGFDISRLRIDSQAGRGRKNRVGLPPGLIFGYKKPYGSKNPGRNRVLKRRKNPVSKQRKNKEGGSGWA
jgi:hypothetical protein